MTPSYYSGGSWQPYLYYLTLLLCPSYWNRCGHQFSPYLIVFPLQKNSELLQKGILSLCWLLELGDCWAAIFDHGMWKLCLEEKDKSMVGGHRHRRMWRSPNGKLGFQQWLSTCWFHRVLVCPSYTFFSRVSFLHLYHKLPLFYFGLSGFLYTQNQRVLTKRQVRKHSTFFFLTFNARFFLSPNHKSLEEKRKSTRESS